MFSAVLAACGGSKDGGAPPVTPKDGPDGLKELIAASHAACKEKDVAKGRAIFTSLIPSKDQLGKALKDGTPPEFTTKVLEQYANIPTGDEKIACLFAPRPALTEIVVHKATTEELAAYAEGTPAHKEFPTGARKLAENVLRPGVAFYEVEVVEPGKDAGVKFHMFFFDGTQWRMLGQAWRALK